MFGTFRFILASLVALSHIGITFSGKNPGVMAVVSFYLLSGFMMTGLIRRYYSSVQQLIAFYLDRAARIFPQYLFIVFLSLILVLMSHVDSPFVKDSFSLTHLFNNITIVPLNFYMFNLSDHFTLIPPSWSLGAELQFYLIIPFILFLGKKFRLFIIILSLLVFVFSSLNMLHSDWFGYRLLPGILFIFLSGSLLYDKHQEDLISSIILWGIFICITIWLAFYYWYLQLNHPYIFEVCCGYLVAVLAANILRQFKRKQWDEYLGHLSYGLFLGHFFILWSMDSFFNISLSGYPVIFLLLTTLLAFIGHELVEKPFFEYRKKKRQMRGER